MRDFLNLLFNSAVLALFMFGIVLGVCHLLIVS